MAVSKEYLEKVRRALREIPDTDTDAEITDIIEECRHDLILLGVLKEKAENEKDPYILGPVRSFARWKYGLNNPEAEQNRDDYMQQRDELRKRVGYVSQ